MFNSDFGGFQSLTTSSGGNQGEPVTDPVVQGRLTTESNWNSNGVYTGAAITGIEQGSWYQTPATGSNTRYYFFFISDNTPIRIPFTNVLLNE
jgi:hypothetical protein